MLFETMKDDIAKSKGIKAGKDAMNLLLVRPFDVIYKGDRYPVLMVRVDGSGSRSYAIPNTEESSVESSSHEPLRWIAERWIDKVLPYDIKQG